MKGFVCEKCGSREFIPQDGYYQCDYCKTIFAKEDFHKEDMIAVAENVVLADHKRALYDLVSDKYSDGENIVKACNQVLLTAPNDRYAQFYKKVYFEQAKRNDTKAVNDFLMDIDLETESAYFIKDVLDCMVKNVRCKNALALNMFMERLENSTLLDKETWLDYQTRIETEITNLRKGVYDVRRQRDIFVMYSSKDIDEVYKLVSYLEEERNLDCFVAARNLRHGEDAVKDFGQKLYTAMKYCKVVVFVSSPHSCADDCGAIEEMKYLLDQEQAGAQKKPRIEYLLGDHQKTRKVSNQEAGEIVAEFFKDLQWCHSQRQLGNFIIEELEKLDAVAPSINAVETSQTVEPSKTQETPAVVEVKTEPPATPKEIEEWYKLGCTYYGKGNYDQAVEHYQKAAKQGHAQAQYQLALCYEEGKCLVEDYQSAVTWYQKAADQGHVSAQYKLAYCYEKGLGVAKNAAQALQWYRKAAMQGDAKAQCAFGRCYADGIGMEKNATKAVEWYKKAAEQGYAEAQCALANCYSRGRGVVQNKQKATEWYQKAAEQNYAEALYQLGRYEEAMQTDDKVFAKKARKAYQQSENATSRYYALQKRKDKQAQKQRAMKEKATEKWEDWKEEWEEECIDSDYFEYLVPFGVIVLLVSVFAVPLSVCLAPWDISQWIFGAYLGLVLAIGLFLLSFAHYLAGCISYSIITIANSALFLCINSGYLGIYLCVLGCLTLGSFCLAIKSRALRPILLTLDVIAIIVMLIGFIF